MAKLEEIITIINNGFKANEFATKRFQKGKFNGLAELVLNKDGNTEPCIISNNGDTEKLDIDDTYPFQLYHRLISIQSTYEENEDGFGDIGFITEAQDMLMVIAFDRSRIQFTKEQIITAIHSSFTIGLTKTQLKSNSLGSCDIKLGNWNLNKYDVYSTEYGEQKQLPTTINLISLSYKITTQINKGCLTLC